MNVEAGGLLNLTQIKKHWCVANWKMHKTPQESVEFLEILFRSTPQFAHCQMVICPQNLLCPLVAEKTRGTFVLWGAQNCCTKSFGAYTGENSPRLLKSLGAKTVLLGHSERRILFNETDDLIAQKVEICTHIGLIPILCVGETWQEHCLKQGRDIVARQIQEGLKLVKKNNTLDSLVIAYEPVWAIGSGKIPSLNVIEEIHQFIKELLSSLFGNMKHISILYGGSVKVENAKLLGSSQLIDGFLIGGASLDVQSFLKIAKILEDCK